MAITEDYHVHVYFDTTSKPTAEQVIDELSSKFPLAVGHFHDHPVGPHPMGSCQLTVAMENLGNVIDWLAKNRRGLTIFTHANTGDIIKDHTDHTIWLGTMPKLNLDILRQFIESDTG